MEARRRIGISFSDPDATDSDSDEDYSTSGAACATLKPAVKTTKILIKMSPAICGGRRAQPAGSPAAMAASSRNRAASSAPAKRYPGVYERQPGRWAAEFRRHSIKVRQWVGTFATEAEAKAAYDAFEKQFLSSPDRGGNGGDVRRSRASSHPAPDENRQVVLALAAPTTAGAKAAAYVPVVPSAPFISSSTPFWKNARLCQDVPLRIHSLWADEPVDEDLLGLADLAHLPLPFSDASMDFDPPDLSLFDNGFL